MYAGGLFMPIIYLSPSAQEWDSYGTDATEAAHMNLLTDNIVPYLNASGMRYVRNDPELATDAAILAANAGDYDLYLALHSSTSLGDFGAMRGSYAFYYPGSIQGQRAAGLLAANLRQISPLSDQVQALPSTAAGELRLVKSPAVMLELAFQDNLHDNLWIQANIDAIARAISKSLAEFFGIPFLAPTRQSAAMVNAAHVDLRSHPAGDATILVRAPEGAMLSIINQWRGWDLVSYNGINGYIRQKLIPFV